MENYIHDGMMFEEFNKYEGYNNSKHEEMKLRTTSWHKTAVSTVYASKSTH